MPNLFSQDNIFKILIAAIIIVLSSVLGWAVNGIRSVQKIVYMEQAQMKDMEKAQESNVRQWQKLGKLEIGCSVNENDIEWLKSMLRGKN